MDRYLIASIIAITAYIIGGLAVFSGTVLIVLMKGKDLLGLGEGDGLGYFLLGVGLGLSLLGVVIMRFLRNRS